MTSNTSSSLMDIWGSSANNVFAVGNGGTIVKLYVGDNNNSIIITAPSAGAKWQRGTSQTIRWTSTGKVGNVQIQLRNSSGNYTNIASSVSNSGSYNWTIPSNGEIGSNFKIRVSDVNRWSTIYDLSSSFSLTGEKPSGTISVTAPAAGAKWQRGTTRTIRWRSTGKVGNVQIQLRNASGNHTTIASSVSNSGSYNWTIPSNGEIGSNFKIRVSDVNQWSTVYGLSGSFSLTGQNLQTISAPGKLLVPKSSTSNYYKISWGKSSTSGVTYVLEEATNSTFSRNRRTAYSGTATNVIITGRSNGKTYFYRVKAVKSGYTDSGWRTGTNGCKVKKSNLVAYYPLDGSAKDMSGNGFHGKVIGAKLTKDRFGNSNSAYDFNNGSIEIPSGNPLGPIGKGAFSVSLWVKFNQNHHGSLITFGKNLVGTYYNEEIFQIYNNQNPLEVLSTVVDTYNEFSNFKTLSISKSLKLNTWYHIVCVVENQELKAYLNGKFIVKEAFKYNMTSQNWNTLLLGGADYGGPGDFLKGSLDEIRIYNRGLTANEIKSLYNQK